VVKIDQREEFRRYQMPVSVRGAVGQIKEKALLRSLLKAAVSPSSEDSLRHRGRGHYFFSCGKASVSLCPR